MKNYPSVSIIVLNYNGLKYLDRCLQSLRNLNYSKNHYNVTVVDNGSIDGSIAFLEENYKEVILIKNKKNLGVCLANNNAIKKTDSEYVLLLNNDLHLHKDFLKNLVAVMVDNPNAGCCGGEEYYYDDNIVNPKGDIRKTSWIGSGATIYSRKALEQSGLFDDSFFFYCEDIDLSWKLKLAGWDIFQNEMAVFYHDGKGRKVVISDKTLLYSWRNRLFLIVKYASFCQMKKSLALYYSLLLSKKNKNETDNKHKKKEILGDKLIKKEQVTIKRKIQKIMFLCKLFFSFSFYLPNMLLKRYHIQKKIDDGVEGKIDYKEVDAWIDYVDDLLR